MSKSNNILLAIGKMQEKIEDNIKVCLCNPKTKEAIEQNTEIPPNIIFIENDYVETNQIYVVEDRKLKKVLLEQYERNKPKKPVEYEDKYYGCPHCGNALLHKWKKYPTILMPKSRGLPYCINCQQAIDWSE